MFSIDIRGEGFLEAAAYLNRVKEGLADRAIASALNKTAAQGKQLTAVVNGNPAGRAKRSLNVIRFAEKKVTLAQARKRAKRGELTTVFVKIKKGSGFKPIPGAFIASNGRTVFRRVGKARLPIEPVQTIGVPQMFNSHAVRDKVEAFITREFPRIFEHEFTYFLSTVR